MIALCFIKRWSSWVCGAKMKIYFESFTNVKDNLKWPSIGNWTKTLLFSIRIISFLFSTVNIFKTKYEFVLTEIRSLAHNSELGGDETAKCYKTLQKKYIHLAQSFTDLVRLVSLDNFEGHSTNITMKIQKFLSALYNYTVSHLYKGSNP